MRGRDASSAAGPGYRGRSAIHELLELDDEIREMLLAKKPGSEIRKKAKREGNGVSAGFGAGAGERWHHNAEGDQQGHVYRGGTVAGPAKAVRSRNPQRAECCI